MSKILGLDIGGANTKFALVESTNNEIKLVQTGSDYFPFSGSFPVVLFTC